MSVSSQDSDDAALCPWVHLGLALLRGLVGALLSTHRLHHLLNVAGHHICFLFLGGERALRRLHALLALLLFLCCVLGVLTHCTIIRVPEVNTHLLGGHVGRGLDSHLFLLLEQDGLNGVLNALGRSSLVVFILAVLVQAHDLLLEELERAGPVALLHLSLLLFDVVASELQIRDNPVVQVITPFRSALNSHVFLGWHELINNQVLESDLSGELTNTVHQVFALTVDHLCDVVEVRLRVLVLSLHLVDLLLLNIKLILLA